MPASVMAEMAAYFVDDGNSYLNDDSGYYQDYRTTAVAATTVSPSETTLTMSSLIVLSRLSEYIKQWH